MLIVRRDLWFSIPVLFFRPFLLAALALLSDRLKSADQQKLRRIEAQTAVMEQKNGAGSHGRKRSKEYVTDVFTREAGKWRLRLTRIAAVQTQSVVSFRPSRRRSIRKLYAHSH
jgi:hypothetical protein